MVRFNDKPQILNSEVSQDDILHITDMDSSENDKKITLGQIKDFVNDGEEKANTNLINTDTITDSIISAPNGVFVANNANTAIVVKNGLHVLIANGRKSDTKRYSVIDYTLDADKTLSITTLSNGSYNVGLSSGGSMYFIPTNDVYITLKQPGSTNQTAYWFDIYNNYWKITTNGGASWSNASIIILGEFFVSNNLITEVDPHPTVGIANFETIEKLITASNGARNTGDIFYTSRLDTSLNGAVECNGNTYSVADYTGDNSVESLLRAGKLPYVSLSEYENIISSKGSCRAFGWDGEDTATFRVPKLTDVYIEAGQANTAGEFIDESLPNVKGQLYSVSSTGEWGIVSNSGATAFNNTGEVFQTDVSGAYTQSVSTGKAETSGRITFNASRSSSTYQDNAPVKPNSVRYRAMVQLFNGATDEAVAICGDVVAELANKVSKTGDTMTGTLTGLSSIPFPFIAKSDSLDATTNPTANTYIGYDIRDKNDSRVAYYGFVKTTDGAQLTEIQNVIAQDNFAFGRLSNGKLYYSKPQILQAYVNGTSGYRIWSDGYCEQWGQTARATNIVVSLPKIYNDVNYNIQATLVNYDASAYDYAIVKNGKGVNYFTLIGHTSMNIDWKTSGYLRADQY